MFSGSGFPGGAEVIKNRKKSIRGGTSASYSVIAEEQKRYLLNFGLRFSRQENMMERGVPLNFSMTLMFLRTP